MNTSGQWWPAESESSARRRRAVVVVVEVVQGRKEVVNKVWKWAVVLVVVSCFSFLQGSHWLACFSVIQILAIRSWHTVSSSDINPKSINSASPIHHHMIDHWYTYYIEWIGLDEWGTRKGKPSLIFCRASNRGFWFCFLRYCKQTIKL